MEYSSGVRLPCLLVSSTYPSHLRSVIAMLHAHGIRTEEGLHRRWHSNEFVPALMVSMEDYPRASVLAESVGPTLRVTLH
jgi:hypothetical protein